MIDGLVVVTTPSKRGHPGATPRGHPPGDGECLGRGGARPVLLVDSAKEQGGGGASPKTLLLQ